MSDDWSKRKPYHRPDGTSISDPPARAREQDGYSCAAIRVLHPDRHIEGCALHTPDVPLVH